MRIKEFSIRKYGPLSDSGVIRLNNFNLFWGENEDGKTLTLEALIRLLLGKGLKLFSGIDRVSEKPDGYLILQNDRDEEFKLPESGQITDLLRLSPEEYRNLFIIRNSDLSIARENQFYGDITERLTGLRTNQINKIKTHLRSLGNFTEGLDTVNTKESRHLKTRLTRAEALLAEYEEFTRQAEAEGFDTLEENLSGLQTQLREINREINALENSRLRGKFETGSQHLDSIIITLENLEALKGVTEEELNKWQQTEVFIEEKINEREQVIDQFQTLDGERVEEEKKLNEYRDQFQINQRRKTGIDELLKPLLRKWNELNERSARKDADRIFFRTGIFIFLILSLLFLMGMFWKPHVYILAGAIASGSVAFGLALFYYLRFVKSQGEFKQVEQGIINQAGELGLAGGGIPQTREQIQRFEEDFQRQQQRLTAAEGRAAFLVNSCRSLREERLGEIDNRIKDARQIIRLFQAKHDVESVEIYREKLQERRELEQEIKESMTTLKSLFGMKGESIPECVQYWQDEIRELKDHKDTPAEITFNEKILEKTKTQKKQLQEDIQKLQRQMHDFKEELADLERRTKETILPEDGLLPCRTLNDLRQLKQHLQKFLKQLEAQQRAARTAIEIFEEIDRDERQKVSALFGEESRISQMYDVVSEGLYPAVFYESDTAAIKIKRRDGAFLPPSWLSSGAYDQLYFIIRMALSEKLLRNQKGFFILDDPFVKSDSERLRRQLEILLDFSQRGWQIIYFSAKDEVRNTLQKYIDRKQVNLQPVPGLSFRERQKQLES